MFKKVYIEITNNCNLNCSFCIHNERKKEYMSLDNFKTILDKLNGYTNYLYLHVLGEPLLHPNINEFINSASKSYKVNITTNGYLIDRLKDNKNIRQINISLHSYNPIYNESLNDYMDNIFNVTDILSKYTYINYRLWVNSKYKNDIVSILEEKYNMIIDGNTKLSNNVFIDFDKEFIWPDLNNSLNNKNGKCYGLIDHFGILVDGTIIPCCLDSKGTINLGNIFNDNLFDILNSTKVTNMINNFKNNNRCEELCQHCGYFIDKN